MGMTSSPAPGTDSRRLDPAKVDDVDHASRAADLEIAVRKLQEAQDASLNLLEDLDRHHRELEAEVEMRKQAQEDLHATLRRTQTQLEVVGSLSEIDVLNVGELDSFASRVTELAAKATGCDRVNAWLFNDDETELRCIDHFELSSGRHSAGMILNEAQFKNEFHVLRQSRYVDADAPLTDPRTAGYVESYLKPCGITAMLDAVIQTGGKNLGVLCFEYVGKAHHWEQDEISFACQLADKIGLMLLNRRRREAEKELRDSESRFRTIFNSVSEAVFAHDPNNGDLLDVNHRATEIFGYSREEILQGDVGLLSVGTPPYTQADARIRMAAATAGDNPPFEWHFKTRDGRPFWGEVSLRRTTFGSREVVLATIHDITWRKQAEHELQFANTVLTTELETSPDAILVVDEYDKIVSFNRRFIELWRVPQALVDARVDAPVLAMVTSQMQDPDAFLAQVKYLVNHRDERSEDELVTKDGRIIDRQTAPLKTADGRYLGRVWFFREVTARRRAELALRDERDFTATLIDSLPGFFVLLDAKGCFVRWNENLPATLGMSDDQLQGYEAIKIIAEGDRGLARAQLREAFVTGRADAEVDVHVKDGHVRRVLWSGRKLMNEGRPYLLAVGFDVTETREAERRLRASEERFRAVSETAQDAMIMIDAAGRVTFWNRAAERTFGYTEEEALGRNVHEWLTPARFREKAEAGMAKFSTTGRGDVLGKTVELAAIRKDGVEIPIELSVAGMRLGAEWHAVAILRDITERKRADEQMARMARHDILTGLANRAVFVEALEHAMVSARRNGKSFAVLYLDLDHFKDINDTLGHPIGDLLLQAVSQRLQSTIRDTDTVARFGGDEFAVVETDLSDPADAAVMADNILKALREPFPIQGNDIRTGASVGIAVYGPDSPDPESLLSHADVALYRAKAEGRGTYRFFTDAMDTEVRSRVSLGGELRDAIASDQLFLVYQPQVDVDTSRIAGVEALVRWRHPTRGLISPAEFVPVAEKNGLIVALGHWVLHEACRQTKEWLDAGISPPLVAVNVSAMQFKTPFALENDIAAILAETGLPSHLLELELTESVLMKASEQHNHVLERLRSTGLRIAIDDFGTGYSSLEYLGRFPVDRIKIAQSFIVDLTSTSDNATIVRAAIGLANDLRRNVIVEGVETAEQLALIRSWGCRDVQGFYFSKPLPAPEIAKLLRSRTILPASAVLADAAA